MTTPSESSASLTPAPAATPPPATRLSSTTVVALIVGILGFATAIITNSTQLQKITEDLTYKDTFGVSGEWTWLFREYRVETGGEHLAGARATLKLRRGIVTGTITTSDGRQRDWKVDGNFLATIHPLTNKEGRFINLNYVSTRPERSQSIGSLVLRYDAVKQIYTGFVTGYDMDIGQIVSFPCILTRETDVVARSQHQDALQKAPKIIEIPSKSP